MCYTCYKNRIQMNEHRYTLQLYKGMNTRFHCPGCKHKDKTFSLYIDKGTGEQVHPTVGRCNRESNCGYHYTPKQYFQDNNISFEPTKHIMPKLNAITAQQKPVSFIPVEVFKASLKAHETNRFVKFLIDQLGVEVASKLVSRYFIGTSKHWDGATVFWQIDNFGKVRTGKIMLYSPVTGKRVKEPFNHIHWVHKLINKPEFELKQCLFGEHLLNIDKNKPVAIVESEKTAVIASVYLPQFIWLAVGSLTNLNAEKCSILIGRTVVLFPDLNGFEKWSSKAKELSNITLFTVSDLLERKATEAEKKQGFDLVDYLIKFDYNEFSQPENLIESNIQQPQISQYSNEADLIKLNNFQPSTLQPLIEVNLIKPHLIETWELEIIELESYFKTVALPPHPIKLNHYSKITDINIFIESHFATVKANNGKRTFLPYLNRLQELKQVLIY
jgi:hypothetical protein